MLLIGDEVRRDGSKDQGDGVRAREVEGSDHCDPCLRMLMIGDAVRRDGSKYQGDGVRARVTAIKSAGAIKVIV